MHGYVTQRRGRFWAVIYEGLGPVPLLWLAAMTGMRRNGVLGLKWDDDIDFKRHRLSLSRGFVAVG